MLTEVTIGRVGRAHGVRGELYVDARTDEPERRFAPGEVVYPRNDGPGADGVDNGDCGSAQPGQPAELTVGRVRRHQQRWLVTFTEIADRDAAEKLRGMRLVCCVPAEESPAGANEYYDRQLIGLPVHLSGNSEPVGTVRSVLHNATQDVLEVEVADEVRLVPLVTALVPEINLADQTVTVADVPGLLTDDHSSDPGSPNAESA